MAECAARPMETETPAKRVSAGSERRARQRPFVVLCAAGHDQFARI
jgi:hypothetical protein